MLFSTLPSGEPAVVVEDPPLKAVKGLLEEGGGLEEEEGLMNRGIAANVDPGVETLVALKDEVVVGGVETLDGPRDDDVKFEVLLDTFGDGTRGWSPSGGKTSFRAPDDHLEIDILIQSKSILLKNGSGTFSFPTQCALPQECLFYPLHLLLLLLNFSPDME